MELWSRVFLTFAFIGSEAESSGCSTRHNQSYGSSTRNYRPPSLETNAAAAAQSKSSNRRPAPSRPATTTQQTAAGALTDECPEPNGYFADGYQCDKYYVCTDGVITEKLCPDGMVFNDYNPSVEKCDLPFNIDCSQRPERQTPKPSQHCPRQNGYFAHEDGHICDKFYYCVDGKYNAITCPAGLVYNENTGICTWPDEAKKKHCSSQEVFQFSCPNVSTTEAQQHPRYADPQDCQYFYVCINGEIPRRNGCKMGQVFNDASKACDWPRNVPECVDWYKGVLTDEELEALEHPKPKPRPAGGTSTRGKTKGKSSRPAVVEDLPVEPDALEFARNSRN